MCKFFSFISNPDKPIPERFMFMDWATRKKILSGKLNYEADTHTSIAHFHNYPGKAEDTLNKYEYNPLTGKFIADQINHKVDDSVAAKKWVQTLDFKKVVEPLIIKPIINPFEIAPPVINSNVLELLKGWQSVWASVRDSVWDSVWDSVRVSIGAYISSFFDIKYDHDFSSLIKLWEMGLVPSFDEKTWRLHGGKKADILWESKV